MSTLELAVVSAIVLAALAIVVIKFLKPFGKPKGSCRACGDTCGCETKEKSAHK